MKNKRISKLESIAREGFLAANDFTPQDGWQNKVIADIKRREHAEELTGNSQAQVLFQPRLVWRFAAASLIVATLICLTLYLSLPENNININDYQISEVSFDNFDNYVEVVAQL